jgi:hypothetical protein
MHQAFRAGFEKQADWKETALGYAVPTAIGAAGGAGIGAIAGEKGHKGKAALKGALAGGLAGAGSVGAMHSFSEAYMRSPKMREYLRRHRGVSDFVDNGLAPTGAALGGLAGAGLGKLAD